MSHTLVAMAPIVTALCVLCEVYAVVEETAFRCFCKIVKRDYYLRLVCLSVPLSFGPSAWNH